MSIRNVSRVQGNRIQCHVALTLWVKSQLIPEQDLFTNIVYGISLYGSNH